jgi:DNA polymerase III alpha subunit
LQNKQEVEEYFKWKVWKGAKARAITEKKEYVDRLKYEVDIILQFNFVEYFLIVADFIEWARNNDVLVGPGRGSAGGSLIAYCLQITQIDPIKYGLYLERFINPGRLQGGGLPDIDVDFDEEGRYKVIEYVTQKYGADKVAHIGTFGSMKSKAAVRAAARTLGTPELGDPIAKQLLGTIHGKPQPIKASIELVPEINKLYKKNNDESDILKWALKIENLLQSAGCHACFSGDSKLLTENGYKTFYELEQSNILTNIITPNGIFPGFISYAGQKDLYELLYSSSKYSGTKNKICLTNDHKVFGDNKWIEAQNSLNVIVTSKPFTADKISELAGWFWNDGGFSVKYNTGNICFNVLKDQEVKKYFEKFIGRELAPHKFYLPKSNVDLIENFFGSGFKKLRHEKEIPIFRNSQEKIGWLRGMMSANASVQRGGIRLKLTSYKLCQFIKQTLEEFGIYSCKLGQCKSIAYIKGRRINGKPSYQFEISTNSSAKYGQLIGFLQTYKTNKLLQSKYQSLVKKNFEDAFDFTILSDDLDNQCGYVEGLLVHNSGLIIGDQPLTNLCPLFKDRRDQITTQYEMKNIEEIGLVKFDFLGLRTLSKVKTCLKLIKKYYDQDIDIYNLNLEDDKVYQELRNGNNLSIFQMENGGGLRDLLVKIRPTKIQDIFAVLSIFRPGPLQSDYMPKYLSARAGLSEPEYLIPELKPILEETSGFLIYQEQALAIAKELCNYSLADADLLRRAIGKKKTKEMESHKIQFLKGWVSTGYKKDIGEILLNQVVKFSEYAFNKSHSAMYGIVSYVTAWLKTYYTKEWMLSNLIWETSNPDQIIIYLGECKRLGIKILPPDINISELSFSFDENKDIRFGLAPIKHLGEDPVKHIIEERNKKPFTGFYDFLNRIDLRIVNRLKVDTLIKSGCFDKFGNTRAALLQSTEKYWQFKSDFKSYEKKIQTFHKKIEEYNERLKEITEGKTNSAGKLVKIFKYPTEPEKPNLPELEECNELPQEEILNLERELLGFFITAHPLDKFAETIKKEGLYTLELVKQLINSTDDNIYNEKQLISFAFVPVKITPFTTKKKKNMAFVDFEDLTGRIEGVVFPRQFEQYKDQLIIGKALKIVGTVDTVEGEESYTYKLIVDRVEELYEHKVKHPIESIYFPIEKSGEILNKIMKYQGGEYKYRIYLNNSNNTLQFLIPNIVYLSKNKEFIEGVIHESI